MSHKIMSDADIREVRNRTVYVGAGGMRWHLTQDETSEVLDSHEALRSQLRAAEEALRNTVMFHSDVCDCVTCRNVNKYFATHAADQSTNAAVMRGTEAAMPTAGESPAPSPDKPWCDRDTETHRERPGAGKCYCGTIRNDDPLPAPSPTERKP